MENLSNYQQSIELLQQLGLKEYEAKCFAALSRLPRGTAKEISEGSEVPRTRVYDAVRVLEAKGLVEVQHSNPQQYRAIPTAEAAEVLRQQYESRTEQLVTTLEGVDPLPQDEDQDVTHEVWALSGGPTIAHRTEQLIHSANEEIILVIGREDTVTEELVEHLQRAQKTGLTVIIGASTESLAELIRDVLPDTKVFVSELEWLRGSATDSRVGKTTISRLLLIDRNTILVSTVNETAAEESLSEKAVFGRGFDNGIVIIARRLMETGLMGKRV
ncbi:MAG: TrmB family transcriptional regulator [Halobacteriota archaeon]